MKILELLIEAIVKTPKGSIIRAQNYLQIELNLKKSHWEELRVIIIPNDLWFTDSRNMIHYQMAEYLIRHTPIDLEDSVHAFIRWDNDGRFLLSPADINSDFNRLERYPVIERLNLADSIWQSGKYTNASKKFERKGL